MNVRSLSIALVDSSYFRGAMLRRSVAIFAAPCFASDLLRGRINDESIASFFMGDASKSAAQDSALTLSPLSFPLKNVTESLYVKPTAAVVKNAPSSLTGQLGDVAYCSIDAIGSLKFDGSTISGTKAVLSDVAAPKTIIAFAEIEGKGLQAFAVDASKVKVSGEAPFLNATFNAASATQLFSDKFTGGLEWADSVLASARIQTTATMQNAIENLVKNCTLYSTVTARYDHHIFRSPHTQHRLAKMRCMSYALESVTQYTAANPSRSPLEGDLAKIVACSAVDEALEHAIGMTGYRGLRPELRMKVADPSKEGDLSCIRDLAAALPALFHTDAALPDLKLNVLAKTDFSTSAGNKARGRLAGISLDLESVAKGIEDDIHSLTAVLSKQKDPTEAVKKEVIVTGVVDIAAEIFASVVTCYRTSALLSEGEGFAEVLLTNVFAERSQLRRRRILKDLERGGDKKRGEKAAALLNSDSELSIHPVMLAPASAKKAAPKAAQEEKKTPEKPQAEAKASK